MAPRYSERGSTDSTARIDRGDRERVRPGRMISMEARARMERAQALCMSIANYCLLFK